MFFVCVGMGLIQGSVFWGVVGDSACMRVFVFVCVCVCVCVCRERVLVAFIQYPVRGCPHGQGTNGFPLKSGEE